MDLHRCCPQRVRIEGRKQSTSRVSISEFTVGNQVVQTDAVTVFENGLPDEIERGVKLEVKGVPADINHSILVADKVTFENN